MLQAEDTVIICDAGGGTVVSYGRVHIRKILMQQKDLCSYVVKSTEPVVVQECVKGDGKFLIYIWHCSS
jgi:hypothetical protein